ncbi:MAG: InlB B-repeat-containing protein [Acholeplasmatales bacterium]|nr:InlB B-repeat-containing protein [Acholeplasmatales bacterium]
MRKFFKNKVFYVLSVTAIIFGCLFMFLFKGPQAEAASIEYDSITAQDIVANNSTKKYTGKYGTWSWTGVSGINTTDYHSMLEVTGYFEINTANDFKLTYTPNAATKSKIASMRLNIYWAGGDECEPGGVNISNMFSANIAATGYWFYTEDDLTSPNTSKSNVVVTIKKPATGTSVIWQSTVRIGYNASAPVTISKGTGVNSVYLATTNNATSGSASGTEYDSGTTVYGYAELAKGYKAKSDWALVSGTANTEGAKYRTGSVSAGDGNFGTISAELITYYITYGLNGGTHGKTHPTSYNITTNTFTISDPTRTGYTFDGWSGTGFTGKVKSLSIAQGSIGDRTYTANWTADTYTIAFNKNATDATGTTNSVTATYDNTRSLTANGYSRVGYDFKGWATSSTGSVVYADGATLTASQVNNLYATAKKGGTYTLYAKWAYVEEIQAVVNDINNIDTLEYTDTCKGKIETAEASYAGLSDEYKEVIAEYAAILENAREVYDNVDAAVKAIDAIGTVEYTNTCKTNIDGAKALYAALEADELAIFPTEKAKALEDADKAYDAMNAINSIGTVVNTETCKTAITTARTAYNNLTADQKALVAESFTKTLEDDEAVFAVIDLVNAIKYENTADCLTRIEDARDAYDDLTADQVAIFPAAELKTLEDAEKAFAVMQAIDAIGVIENTATSRGLVKTARDAYDALENNEQKALVLNYQALEDAENSFEKVDNTDKLINDIGTLVYPDSEATISAAKAAYNELTPFEKGLVLNYETLTHKDKAYETIKKINQIGSVTYPGSGDAIEAARAAYDDLTDLEKDYVGYEYLAILATAEGYYNSLKNNAKADDVIAKIKAFAPVEITDVCKEKIDIARAAYDALENDDQRELVYNYEDLTKAETDYAAAKIVVDLIKALGDVLATPEYQEKITAAREAYGKLTADQQALVYNYKDLTDREAAKPVVDAIALIDEVDGTTECQEMLTAVRTAYNELSADQQAIVLNIDALDDADAAKVVADLIQAIAPIVATEACQEKIAAAREAYGKLTVDQQALVSNYDDLLAAEAVKPVVDKIAAIGTIDGSEACQGRIADARKAFDELDEDEQALVSNKDDLLNAETVEPVVEKINTIGDVTYPTSKTAIETARAAYGELNETQQALVPAEILKALEDAEAEFKESDDEAKANAAIEKINAIDEVTYPTSKTAIDAARAAYKDLTDDQKELIPAETLKVLEDAEALYNAVDAVVGLIDDIGEVAYTEESKGKIDAAREAYEALTDAQKEIFPEDSLDELEAAEKQYQDLLDQAFAQAVIDKINNIGKVKYPTSEAAIKDAREAYEALTDVQKTIVGYDNYSKLVQAEGNLEAQKDLYFADKVKKLIIAIAPLEVSDECKAKIDAARKAYDDEEFTDEQRVLVTNYEDLVNAETNYAAAKKVVDLIDQLPDKLAESRTAYNALTTTQKALVYNYSDLLDAEASKVDTLISAIGTVAYTADSKAKIDAARAAYNELEDDAKDTVKNLEVLTNAETQYVTLKTKAINDAKDKISAIGTVVYTEESNGKIVAARKAFDAVLAADQSLVTNKQTLLDAEAAYAALEADHKAAEAVDKLIDAIGTVAYTEDCKKAINDARTEYDKLTADQKDLVTKLQALQNAEGLYNAVDAVVTKINAIPSPLAIGDACESAIAKARSAYDALGENNQALVPEDMLATLVNNEKAYPVMVKIEDIKPFALDDNCKTRIDTAKGAYDALTEAQQALVANANELEKAISDYNLYIDTAKAEDVDALIDAIGTVAYTTDCKTKIDAARDAYEALTDTQQGLVTKLQALQTAEASYKAVDDFVKAVDAIGIVELTDACKTKINAANSLYLELGGNTGLVPATTIKTFEDASGAYNVMEKIAAIGTVAYTEDCKKAINDARTEYDKLTTDQKDLVTNYQTLVNAEGLYNAVDDVVTKINAIPSPLVISVEVAQEIEGARAAYELLTEAEEDIFPVDKLALLEKIEDAFDAMKQINEIPATIDITDKDCLDAIDAARESYDDLTKDEQALVTNYNVLENAEVAVVKARIDAIGIVVYTDDCKAKIDAARAAYDALTESQKGLVTNYQTLVDAEAAYAKLKADNEAADKVKEDISKIGTVEYTEESKANIETARTEYDKLTADQKGLVTNYQTLVNAETAFNTAQNNAINNVIGLIDAIKDFAYNSTYEDGLYDARDAYEDLLLSDQASVTNYQTLVNAETLFGDIEDVIDLIKAIPSPLAIDLDTDDAISEAREAYDALGNNMIYVPSTYTNLLESSEAAYDVMELIDLIPDEIDINDDDCVNAIFDAKDAYAELKPSIQALVANSAELEAAIEKYNDLNDKAAAALVDSLINEIGEVEYTDVCKAKIDIARNAYNNLENNPKALVTKLQTLVDAETAYAELEAAKVVIDKIDAIGTLELTDAKKALIDDAKNAYEALTNTQKALVTNIADLNKAITDYDNAKNVKAKIDAIGTVTYTDASKTKIEDARDAYEALTEDQKTLVGMSELEILVNAEEKYEVLVVIDLIGKIGQVKYPTSEAAIKVAREAYDTLTEAQKTSITNTNVLTLAEATYAELKTNNEAAASVDALINAIGTVAYTTDCKNKIEAAIKAYNGLTPAQQALVKGVDTLDKADEKYEQLELDATRHAIVDTKSGVEIETKDGTGIPKTITLKVEVKTTVSATEGSTAYAKITAMLEDREEIKGVYDVKLIQTINGVEKVVQPSEIKAGTKIKIHITIPEGIDGSEARILHIHSENDMEYVKDVQVVGNEFVFEVDRLSEFAIITPASGLPNWSIAAIIGGGIVLVIVIGCLVIALVDRNKKKLEE